MQQLQQPQKLGRSVNGELGSKKSSRSKKTSSKNQSNNNIFDPNKYMLKLPKNKKVVLSNGQVKWEKAQTDYLPVAPRIAWFRKEHPDWSIITNAIESTNNSVVMKAIIKDSSGKVIATARKRETENGFPDYIEKAETGAIGRALAMCGYGTLQAPEFDEGERFADAPIAKGKKSN